MNLWLLVCAELKKLERQAEQVGRRLLRHRGAS